MKRYILAAMLTALPAIASADFSGKVVNVIDGDTVRVLNAGKAFKVRLNGIDAPESHQPFGQRSKQSLIKLAAQKDVTVLTTAQDRYGRFLGTLMLNGRNLNAEQVRSGMAWAYRYHGKAVDASMLALEEQAREQKLGLWSAPGAVEPWKWRRANRDQHQ
ncbi:thermonuclease family protein [Klebsiella pneumoniae]|uniref:thermonuclease family protein n=1 Tax=Klebsiella pneumoniae TaxID=573 RepID=UPI0018A3E3B8|nr:thermonuclease family protein [Klebsiella pneumoniae]MDE8392920.1 thermonuclease family protein [Klebsiella pneumoniae]BBW89478.1 chromosome partitioning protein ParB [Klebsiella pneumoniae]HBU8763987.1 thermonuclease family protein [Klebsiella pneumoniae]